MSKVAPAGTGQQLWISRLCTVSRLALTLTINLPIICYKYCGPLLKLCLPPAAWAISEAMLSLKNPNKSDLLL